jgi:hypothetical protein
VSGKRRTRQGRSGARPAAPLPAFDPKPSARFAHELLTEVEARYALIGPLGLWVHLPQEQHEFTKDIDVAVPESAIEPLKDCSGLCAGSTCAARARSSAVTEAQAPPTSWIRSPGVPGGPTPGRNTGTRDEAVGSASPAGGGAA